RRHTRFSRDWSSDVCSSDLETRGGGGGVEEQRQREAVVAVKVTRSGHEKGRTAPPVEFLTLGLRCPICSTAFTSELPIVSRSVRSEERRVGKDGRSGCSPDA